MNILEILIFQFNFIYFFKESWTFVCILFYIFAIFFLRSKKVAVGNFRFSVKGNSKILVVIYYIFVHWKPYNNFLLQIFCLVFDFILTSSVKRRIGFWGLITQIFIKFFILVLFFRDLLLESLQGCRLLPIRPRWFSPRLFCQSRFPRFISPYFIILTLIHSWCLTYGLMYVQIHNTFILLHKFLKAVRDSSILWILELNERIGYLTVQN